ncbi:MAG: hypothetical protein ACXQTS_01560 [Candidatus Methanospirareceae archaeon]
MREGKGVRVEKFNEKANILANEYWRLKGIIANKANDKRLREIEELLEKGIGGKLREKLEEEARKLKKEKEDISSAFVGLEDVKREIMEITAELAPNLDLMRGNIFPYDSEHEPLSEKYFAALNDIFFGVPQEKIEFKEATLSKEGIEIHSDSKDSPLSVLNYVITIIQEAAKKKLGVKNKIEQAWKLLIEDEYAMITLQILATEGRKMGLEEIKEISHRQDREYKELVRDYDKNLARAVQSLTEEKWGYSVVRECDGKYEITDFGKWVWDICHSDAGMKDKKEGGVQSGFYKLTKLIRKLR